MRLIQVIFGAHRESDFQCKRCGGNPTGELCFFCGGRPLLELPRAYTYALPDGLEVKLWDHVWVPNHPFPKLVTVVALTSDYQGDVKTIIPNQTLVTGDAPVFRVPNGTPRGAPEWTT